MNTEQAVSKILDIVTEYNLPQQTDGALLRQATKEIKFVLYALEDQRDKEIIGELEKEKYMPGLLGLLRKYKNYNKGIDQAISTIKENK